MIQKTKKLGLALGSGGARGFAHLGILEGLLEMGLVPEVVSGASVGALIGAYYVAGQLPECRAWAQSLNFKKAFSFLDVQWIPKSGFVKGDKIIEFFSQSLGDTLIENLPKPFAAVATQLQTGQEVWLKKGSLTQAMRASMAFPGLFPAIQIEGEWLIDGGLVNPVPISVCRALSADIVIAVDLNQFRVGQRFQKAKIQTQPSILDVTLSSVHILQDRITKSRMSGDPADVLLAPKLSHVGLLDFGSVNECIEEGLRVVEKAAPSLQELKKLIEGQNEN